MPCVREQVTHRRPDLDDDAVAHALAATPVSDRNRAQISHPGVTGSRQRLFSLLGADPRLVRLVREMRTGVHELGPG